MGLSSYLTPIPMADLNLEGDLGDLLRISKSSINYPYEQEHAFIYISNYRVEETIEKLRLVYDLISVNNSKSSSVGNSNFPGNAVDFKFEEKLPYCDSELSIRQMNVLNKDDEYDAIVIISYKYERKPKLLNFQIY